jgi:hypothetical protein
MCVYFHKNCNKISIFKFLAYRVYEGYDKAVEDETSHTYMASAWSVTVYSGYVYTYVCPSTVCMYIALVLRFYFFI